MAIINKVFKYGLNSFVFLLIITIFVYTPHQLVQANGREETNITTDALLAFPGAEGFGKNATGGRGGVVVVVNTITDDKNPQNNLISLREALEMTVPRIVVFAVGGLFDVGDNDYASIKLNNTNSNLTVACQTAPSPGVNVRGSGIYLNGVSNTIWRHCTSRLVDPGPGRSDSSRNFSIIGTNSSSANHIFDHMSLSWATDENWLTYIGNSSSNSYNRNVTLQQSIIAEGDSDSSHPESGQLPNRYIHAMGPTCSSADRDRQVEGCSIYKNLIAHNARRNPRVKGFIGEVVNNIVYNYNEIGIDVLDNQKSGVSVNVTNNYLKRGPTTKTTAEDMRIVVNSPDFNYVVDDNILEGTGEISSGTLGTTQPLEVTLADVNMLRAQGSDHMRCLGASRPHRDVIDQRIIDEYNSGSGQTGISDDHIRNYSMYPTVATTHPWQDIDEDGMPDSWERKHGVNDPTAHDLDPLYENVEVYINRLAECPMITITAPLAGTAIDMNSADITIQYDSQWETWPDGQQIELCSSPTNCTRYSDKNQSSSIDVAGLGPGSHVITLELIDQDGARTGIRDSRTFMVREGSTNPQPTNTPVPSSTINPTPANSNVPTVTPVPSNTPVRGVPQNGRVATGLQALYLFDEKKGNIIYDRSGIGDPLDLLIEETSDVAHTSSGLELVSESHITSAVAATKISQSCANSNEIAIEAWVRPANETQTGPARIVTLSEGMFLRNFALGQVRTRFEFRLKTNQSDTNGLPGLRTSWASVPTDFVHVVYNKQADGVAKIFVNGTEEEQQPDTGTITEWTDNFKLSLGNEIGADRAWLGTYRLVAIYCQGLSSEEIVQNYTAGYEFIGTDPIPQTSVPTSVPTETPQPINTITSTPVVPPAIESTPTSPTPNGELTSITGRVYSDENTNGQYDDGEPVFPNIIVILIDTGTMGQTVTVTSSTDSGGIYAFSNIPAANYVISFAVPPGYASFATNNLIVDTTTGNTPVANVGLVESNENLKQNPGNVEIYLPLVNR